MSKCERCGLGGLRFLRGAIKFKDKKYICVKCLKELGHDHPLKDAYYLSLSTSDEILRPVESRREKEAAHKQWLADHPEFSALFDEIGEGSSSGSDPKMPAVSSSIVSGPGGLDVHLQILSNYGQERELVCTEEEREIFDIIRSICDDYNLDSGILELVRKSDDYVTAIMRSQSGYGLMDVARIKYTNRAKWIKLCPEFERVYLSDPEDVASMTDGIRRAYLFNQKYL